MHKTPDNDGPCGKLSGGDDHPFESLYRKHSNSLRNFLRRYLGDPKAADDIVQEAYLELWKHPNGFNPARGTLKAYLFGIARKRAADWWRRHPARESGTYPERPVPHSESAVSMAEALEQLQPEMRCLVWLRDVEGYSYAELAEILDIPAGTVKSRLFSAREHLRSIWKGAGT